MKCCPILSPFFGGCRQGHVIDKREVVGQVAYPPAANREAFAGADYGASDEGQGMQADASLICGIRLDSFPHRKLRHFMYSPQ